MFRPEIYAMKNHPENKNAGGKHSCTSALFTYITAAYRPCAEAFAEAL